MTIDRELVTRKVLLILRDLDSVVPLARKPLDEYLQSALATLANRGSESGGVFVRLVMKTRIAAVRDRGGPSRDAGLSADVLELARHFG